MAQQPLPSYLDEARMDRRRVALVAAASIAAAVGLGALASACGGEDSTTGKRLTHATRITAGPEATSAFTNAYGWSITLSRIDLSVGAFHYFDGAPVTARLHRPRPLLDRLARWALPEAHAHPGHYQPGDAMGQMTEPTTVDLAKSPADLAASAAVSGVYRSARFTFGAPPRGPLADELGDAVILVEGLATKAGEARPFRVAAVAADVLDAKGNPLVAGCVFEEADVQENGAITLLVKPSVWLDQIDFTEVPASADGQPVTLEPATVPYKAFTRGLEKGTAYVFSYAAAA